MATPTITPYIRTAIGDALAGARGAAAGLGSDAIHLAEAAAELPDNAPIELVKLTAHTLQARAQRAALGALAAGAAAARLEAYAHALAIEAQQHAAAATAVRQRLEAEAARDAGTYLAEGETEDPESYAIGAFNTWLDDAGPEVIGALTRQEAAAAYLAAFLRALSGAS
jgi:hypothetical protein